ncbi:hypothetical protein UFOVP1365_7 [uncultured Caudovirales phage]|uniref:Terminase-like family n=1 Tax=uncultured Caudovirales phage TaxID=2100421 RepID=A0A6J5RX24_9CAUD|nr:hypothetical protein UFOVP1365_7 [uncultured Caudovirales phage]
MESEIKEWGLYPRQMQAFLSPATELLFGGASEGGKSYFVRYALCAWCAAIPSLQVFIFRKHYADVVGNHMDGPSSFPMMLQPWIKDKLVSITENTVYFNFNKSSIQMLGLLHKKDLDKHQGRDKHVLVIDEATQTPWSFVDGLRGWVRMPKDMKDKLPEQLKDIYPHISPEERRGLFPRIIYTANPIGQSVGAFRRAFITPREPLAIEKVGAFTRQYIPSKVTDNPSADPEAQRERLKGAFGEDTAMALITGDWTTPTGDFFPEYDDELHSVPDFEPPNHWFKFRTFDWGGRDPFAVYWWCISDGEEFEYRGKTRYFPRGSLIAYREWYGCLPDDPAKGINMRNEDIARGIVERTPELTSNLTFTDSFPFADRGSSKDGRKYTMADDFLAHGCPLTLGNTARVFGYKQMRSRLQGESGVPLLYMVKSCFYLRDYIPALPYHETKREDAAESGEATHSTDACRLACAIRPIVKDAPKDAEFSPRGMMSPKRILQFNKPKKDHLGSR